MIYCNNCQSEHMVSEAFCRSMNAPIAAHDQWVADRAAGVPEPTKAAPVGAGLVGGKGKPSTHVMDRHQSPITLRDTNAVVSGPVATDKQTAFILSLLTNRVVPTDASGRLSAEVKRGTLNKRKAGDAIEWLLRQPKVIAQTVTPTVRPTFAVPDGRYALDSVDSEPGKIVFYRVKANRGFINVSRMSSDNEIPVRWAQAQGVLRRIEAVGTHAAMIRYGQTIGRCGHCGRTLTDQASRAAGIGPICASKF